MAFDGITVRALCLELDDRLKDGRVKKVAQPEENELLLTVNGSGGQVRLLISASATLPLVYITEQNKTSPATAPAFCMLLRKYLTGARILSVTQPGLERVLRIAFEHRDEMGDMQKVSLMVEIMGKHSNIIFVNEEDRIIDSIKRIPASVSSVREVLPGRDYFIPETQDKKDIFTLTPEDLETICSGKPVPVYKALYSGITGISPMYAQEIVFEAGLDPDRGCNLLEEGDIAGLHNTITGLAAGLTDGKIMPEILYEYSAEKREAYFDHPVDFCALCMESYPGYAKRSYTSVSRLLEDFYSGKNMYVNMRQKSADLRHIVTTALERCVKKYDLQMRQMKDTEKRDKYRIWGELLNTFGYSAKPGDKSIRVNNYYTGEDIDIPLDETLSPQQNAVKYFDRYNKLKRTFEALSTLTVETKAEIDHLESVLTSLDLAQNEDDLNQIREELMDNGLIRRKARTKKVSIRSKPLHFTTEDGFHIYIGKNNLQNDELTFKLAGGSDWWFHAKQMPGSHVILKTEGREVPDHVFEIAAAAAGFYSSGADQPKVEIDYVQRKEVKKPAGAKPGFVVYYTNYSMAIAPGIGELTPV